MNTKSPKTSMKCKMTERLFLIKYVNQEVIETKNYTQSRLDYLIISSLKIDHHLVLKSQPISTIVHRR